MEIQNSRLARSLAVRVLMVGGRYAGFFCFWSVRGVGFAVHVRVCGWLGMGGWNGWVISRRLF